MTDMQIVEFLRRAARNPGSWDVPGLLLDAADRIEKITVAKGNEFKMEIFSERPS
jgi:hypothetical protein